MSGKTARRLRKATATHAPLTFKVTQPHAEQKQIPYPPRTTRVSSNARFIHTANHPQWYEIARNAEDDMIGYFSREQLEGSFREAITTAHAESPLHAYGLAIIKGFKDYGRRNLRQHPEMATVLDNAAMTVLSNLAQVIFRDESNLTRGPYPPEQFEEWASRVAAFNESDVFTYRPPESGIDVDGKEKPIVELCPTPLLGRHLVRTGYEVLVDYLNHQTQVRP